MMPEKPVLIEATGIVVDLRDCSFIQRLHAVWYILERRGFMISKATFKTLPSRIHEIEHIGEPIRE